jgi:hypothetical protein
VFSNGARGAHSSFLLWPFAASGFAGLGTENGGFATPQTLPSDFQTDHGPHADYRIEWWYLTTLQAADGAYGLQWTLFAPRLPEQVRMVSPQLDGSYRYLTYTMSPNVPVAGSVKPASLLTHLSMDR